MTGAHLQADEERFLQSLHPFQCLPGAITSQEEGKQPHTFPSRPFTSFVKTITTLVGNDAQALVEMPLAITTTSMTTMWTVGAFHLYSEVGISEFRVGGFGGNAP